MGWKIKKEDYINNNNKYCKIANTDIVVYKFGTVGKDGNFYPHYIKNFAYKPNKINDEIKLVLSEKYKPNIDDITELIIINGYHSLSECCLCNIGLTNGHCFNGKIINVKLYNDKTFPYKTLDIVRYPDRDCGNRLSIGTFIIPANTEYYDDGKQEFVSSNIIWTGESYLVHYIKTNNTLTTINALICQEKNKKLEFNRLMNKK